MSTSKDNTPAETRKSAETVTTPEVDVDETETHRRTQLLEEWPSRRAKTRPSRTDGVGASVGASRQHPIDRYWEVYRESKIVHDRIRAEAPFIDADIAKYQQRNAARKAEKQKAAEIEARQHQEKRLEAMRAAEDEAQEDGAKERQV